MSVKDKYQNSPPALRRVIAAVAIIVVILLILQLLLAIFADDYLASRLKEKVRRSSPYTLTFDDLDLNLFSGSIEISEIDFSADSTAARGMRASTIKAEIESIKIEEIGFLGLLFNDKLSVDEIVISKPQITIAIHDKDTLHRQNNLLGSLDSLIYSAAAPRFEMVKVDHFVIKNAQITALKAENADTMGTAEKLNLTLRDIIIDSSAKQDEHYFITDNFSLQIDNGRYRLSNLYEAALDKVEVSSSRQSLKIDSLRLIPQYPKFDFGRVNGYEIDRIELLIPSIKLQQINVEKLIQTGRLEAEKLIVNQASFVDFRNKQLPFPPGQEPPLPHIALRNLPLTLKIDSVEVNDAYVEYNEYWGAAQAGTVTFEHLDGVITNVTNYPELIEQNIIMTMDASAQVMGAALLNTHFEFPMNTEIGFHRIEGTLEAMPITALNPMLKYVAFVEIDEGKINHLEFSMTLNENESRGEMIMNYEDLKISFLDKETMEQTGLLTDVKSLFANAVIVKGNTPDEGMRLGTISFERVQRKSYWNYWWKSLFSGMKDLILD